MAQPIIQPRTLKGFRDYPPQLMIPRERLIQTAQSVFRSYGFSPLDTPALEYLEVLAGKGGEESDKQLYRFQDHGQRWVGLRFDLTVPLARFAAQNAGQLTLPFKRYHIAPVWRGENTQRGRYREFVQCDFDTVGTTTVVADIETTLVIFDLLSAIGFAGVQIRVNHRQVLTGLLEKHDLVERSGAVLRVLDKLAKVGSENVAEELVQQVGISRTACAAILELASLKGDSASVLSEMERIIGVSEVGQTGLARLNELVDAVTKAGIPTNVLRIDPSIARGLDYYTGTVFETFLNDLPDIGSVCSGGRYDDLAGLYTKQQLPGVGASLGLDRLLAAMEELGLVEERYSPADIFVPFFDSSRLGDYLWLTKELRRAGFTVAFFPEPKKIGQQLKYADRLGFPWAVIIGKDEWSAKTCQIKNMRTGDSESIEIGERGHKLIDELRIRLAEHQ